MTPGAKLTLSFGDGTLDQRLLLGKERLELRLGARPGPHLGEMNAPLEQRQYVVRELFRHAAPARLAAPQGSLDLGHVDFELTRAIRREVEAAPVGTEPRITLIGVGVDAANLDGRAERTL